MHVVYVWNLHALCLVYINTIKQTLIYDGKDTETLVKNIIVSTDLSFSLCSGDVSGIYYSIYCI